MRAKDTYGCENAPISLLRSCKQGLRSRKTWHLAPPPGSHSLSQQSYRQWRISRVVWALGSHRVPTRQWSRGRRSVYARAALAATAGGTVLAGQAQGRKRGHDDPGGAERGRDAPGPRKGQPQARLRPRVRPPASLRRASLQPARP